MKTRRVTFQKKGKARFTLVAISSLLSVSGTYAQTSFDESLAAAWKTFPTYIGYEPAFKELFEKVRIIYPHHKMPHEYIDTLRLDVHNPGGPEAVKKPHITLLKVLGDAEAINLEASSNTKEALANQITQEQNNVENALLSGGFVVIRGGIDYIQKLRPKWISVWPKKSLLVATTLNGAHVIGLDDTQNFSGGMSDEAINQVLSAMANEMEKATSITNPTQKPSICFVKSDYPGSNCRNDEIRAARRQAQATGPITVDLNSVIAEGKSPAEVCRAINERVFNTASSSVSLTSAQTSSLRVQLSKICQYGAISQYAGSAPLAMKPAYYNQFGINTFVPDPPKYFTRALLTIQTEYGLIRSKDPLNPDNPIGNKFYFWVKTLGGDGSGVGFTRNPSNRGLFQPLKGGLSFGLAAHAIHNGWGRTHAKDIRSWTDIDNKLPRMLNMKDMPAPPNPDYIIDGNHNKFDMFDCQRSAKYRPTSSSPIVTGMASFPLTCPIAPSLIHVYPKDTFDNTVTVANAYTFGITGSVSIDRVPISETAGGTAVGLSLGISIGETKTVTRALNLTQIQNTAHKEYARSTFWKPNLSAVHSWGRANSPSELEGSSLDTATPLASTLNPAYDAIWSFPATGNLGRSLVYSMLYTTEWNTCNQKSCEVGPPSILAARAETVYWENAINIEMPKD